MGLELDYKELLTKYMARVVAESGRHFIPNNDSNYSELFNLEEVSDLYEILTDIINQEYYDS